MAKIITMYHTAVVAEKRLPETLSYAKKSIFEKIISNFNNGKHVTCKANNENHYSILNN